MIPGFTLLIHLNTLVDETDIIFTFIFFLNGRLINLICSNDEMERGWNDSCVNELSALYLTISVLRNQKSNLLELSQIVLGECASPYLLGAFRKMEILIYSADNSHAVSVRS